MLDEAYAAAMRYVVAGLVLLAVLLVAFGGWYAGAVEWHSTRPGYEGRVEITVWPPSIGWGERLAD